MMDDDQHTVSDCHNGFLLTQARSEMMELSRKVIVTHMCEHPSNLGQNRTEVAVAFGRLAMATFACTQVASRTESHPRSQVCRTWKRCHIGPEFRKKNGSRAPRNARDRHEKRKTFLKRRQALRHFLLQLPNTRLPKIEMGKGLFEQKPMMGFEVSLQSLLELSNLRAHPTTGQLGQLSGIALSRNEGFQHLPGTFPDDISDDRTQLDIGGFQDLVDAVNMPVPLLHQVGMAAHQVTQLPNGLGGMKLALSRPWRKRSAIHSLSLISVLCPGMACICCALTNTIS